MSVATQFAVCLGLLSTIFAMFFGYMAGISSETNRFRNEAVRLGLAEYFVDENNVRQWRWKAER
jgi:hypothetical protein